MPPTQSQQEANKLENIIKALVAWCRSKLWPWKSLEKGQEPRASPSSQSSLDKLGFKLSYLLVVLVHKFTLCTSVASSVKCW